MKKNEKTVGQTVAEIKSGLKDYRKALKKKELTDQDVEALEPIVDSLETIVDALESTADKIELIDTLEEQLETMKDTLGIDEESAEESSVLKTLAAMKKKIEEQGQKAVSRKSIKEACREALKDISGQANVQVKIGIGGMVKSVTIAGEPILPQAEFVGVIEQIILSGNVSELINVGTTDKMMGSITATRESSEGDIAQQVNLGDKKAEIKATYTAFEVPIKTFAGWIKIAKQQLNDLGWLENTIVNLIARKVRRFWEAYLFNVASSSGTLYDGTTLAGSISRAQIADAIFAIATQLRSQGFEGNIGALLNPIDLAKIRTIKDANGNYIATSELLAGITLMGDPNQPVGNVTVGDFDFMNALVNMSNASAKLFDQNEDDVIRNMVTLLAEFFGCAWLDNNDAFITADISTVITAINKA